MRRKAHGGKEPSPRGGGGSGAAVDGCDGKAALGGGGAMTTTAASAASSRITQPRPLSSAASVPVLPCAIPTTVSPGAGLPTSGSSERLMTRSHKAPRSSNPGSKPSPPSDSSEPVRCVFLRASVESEKGEERRRERHTDTQTHRHTDIQTHTDTQTHRHTDTHSEWERRGGGR